MRTIKFRAWHKEEKLMIPEVLAWVNTPSAQYIKFAKIKDYQGNPLNNPTFANLDQVELMQFTGLLDKNGVEIFEGDIVKGDSWGKREIKFASSQSQFVAKYFKSGLGHWDISAAQAANSSIIIGNIYENKNLLEREDG